jgi:thiamine biosynthesis lipoprotein
MLPCKIEIFLSLLLTALLGMPLSAQEQSLYRYEYTQIRMGVQARIVLYALNSDIAEEAARAAFHRFEQLEASMSDYRPTSELMRLCQKAGGAPVAISKELFLVLERSQEMAEKSGGAFDVTISPLVRLWRKARKTGILPTPEEIHTAKQKVGYKNLVLNRENQTAQLLLPNMQLDLGGIAKGYACDEAQKVLLAHGVKSALVEAGGDIAVSDPPPGAKGWKIEVVNPDPKARFRILTVSNCGVSSSGDTEQHLEFGGKRYSHIVDPKTGYGLTSHIAATVIAPQGILSDALSTTLSVLGEKQGKALAKTFSGVRVSIRRVVFAPSSLETEEEFLLRDSEGNLRL